MFSLTIKTDKRERADKNAFDDPNELPRVLELVVQQLRAGYTMHQVFDANGNWVGNWAWVKEKPKEEQPK